MAMSRGAFQAYARVGQHAGRPSTVRVECTSTECGALLEFHAIAMLSSHHTGEFVARIAANGETTSHAAALARSRTKMNFMKLSMAIRTHGKVACIHAASYQSCNILHDDTGANIILS
ncbi:unnamed protein product [Ostreobium quekettii]|uniref:Uncharacterized protein n=1 Tax=Ostreobium quekettii TaxID=121088 RepID=A0A8S1J938_9CHLO|nr:unnamed protein product [Ostreobium quekettii]